MAFMRKTPHTHKPSTSTAAPRDFRQEVTDQIIALLEKGVAPWQKPWDVGGSGLMPINQVTKRAYRGGNVLHLMITAQGRGYDDPRWLTYKQASDNKWQVRKGEKGTQIEFWEVRTSAGQGEAATGQEDKAEGKDEGKEGAGRPSKFIHRIYTVFNANQIDGIPPLEIRKRAPFEVSEAGENILRHSGASITHDQADRAFYNPVRDDIHLPRREAFPDAGSYYGTALHELAHWTGHPSRLNRLTLGADYQFGNPSYAKEELRAEIASVFMAAEEGIPHAPERHAAYVGNWIKALQEDKNEIFRAAHDASAITDYLLAFKREKATSTPEPIPASPPETPAPAQTHAVRVQQARTLTLDLDQGPGR